MAWKGAEAMTDYVLPGILLSISLIALHRKENLYDDLVTGASQGLHLLGNICPSLVILLTAVSMLRSSGALEALSEFLAPLCARVGIMPELLPIMLVRPLSGSAALAVFAELLSVYGPDSSIGRTAAIMLGSTETTFYTISVYFGATGIQKTRYTVPAALAADLTGFLTACFWQNVFF